MKHTQLLALIVASLAAFAATAITSPVANSAQPAPVAGSSGIHKNGVRAEVEDLDGNHPHTYTICHLVNASSTVPIVVDRILVLGPGGRNDVMTQLAGFAGAVIPPLGELRVELDLATPGIIAQTTETAPGVRNVVVQWSGLEDSLSLSSTLIRYSPPDDNQKRIQTIEQGYKVLD